MTSISTLLERLRRATQSAEPMRDVAVVVSEFVDDGGVELLDDPFHPARKDHVEGLVAPLALTENLALVLVRSAPGLAVVPQRHGVPVALAVLSGRVMVDVFDTGENDELMNPAGGVEVLPEEVYVIEPDVVHNVRFIGEVEGQALHTVIGDLNVIQRSRWIDGEQQVLAASTDYPLTALPMTLASEEAAALAEESAEADEASEDDSDEPADPSENDRPHS